MKGGGGAPMPGKMAERESIRWAESLMQVIDSLNPMGYLGSSRSGEPTFNLEERNDRDI